MLQQESNPYRIVQVHLLIGSHPVQHTLMSDS